MRKICLFLSLLGLVGCDSLHTIPSGVEVFNMMLGTPVVHPPPPRSANVFLINNIDTVCAIDCPAVPIRTVYLKNSLHQTLANLTLRQNFSCYTVPVGSYYLESPRGKYTDIYPIVITGDQNFYFVYDLKNPLHQLIEMDMPPGNALVLSQIKFYQHFIGAMCTPHSNYYLINDWTREHTGPVPIEGCSVRASDSPYWQAKAVSYCHYMQVELARLTDACTPISLVWACQDPANCAGYA